MLKQTRIKKILELLTNTGKVSIKALADDLVTSEATIRRDLDYLANSYPEIDRTFGGAIFNKIDNSSEVELLFDIKMDIEKQAKIKMATLAKEFITDGDTILIDSGSSCYYFAKEVVNFNKLTVICTDLKIAEMLAYHNNITTFIVGGEVRHSLFSIGSHYAENFLDNFSISKVFMSCDAVNAETGHIATSSMFEVGLKKQIYKSGEKVYLLADSSKFAKNSTYTIGDFSKITKIITDYQPTPQEQIMLNGKIVN